MIITCTCEVWMGLECCGVFRCNDLDRAVLHARTISSCRPGSLVSVYRRAEDDEGKVDLDEVYRVRLVVERNTTGY